MTTSARGFTLIETITVIAILALVGGALTYMIQYFYRSNDYVLQEETAVANARQGLSTSIESLREASYADDGSYPISSAATSSITFYADVNNTGDVEEIKYYLSGSTLYRGIITATGTPPSYVGQKQATSTIAVYVVNSTSTPIFAYYDSSGNQLSTPINIASIASIGTTLKIDVDPNRAPVTYTLIGNATLRNLDPNI